MMCKTSLTLKIVIATLLITLLALGRGYNSSSEPASTPGYISYSLQWDSVIPGQPIPEKIRYCIYPSGDGAMIQTDGDGKGIKLALPPDNYKVLIYTYDVRNIDFKFMRRFNEAKDYLRSMNRPGNDPQGLLPFYKVVIESLVVTPGMDSTQVLIPSPAVSLLWLADDHKTSTTAILPEDKEFATLGSRPFFENEMEEWLK